MSRQVVYQGGVILLMMVRPQLVVEASPGVIYTVPSQAQDMQASGSDGRQPTRHVALPAPLPPIGAQLTRFGNIPTTSVRLRIPLLNRSKELFDQILVL